MHQIRMAAVIGTVLLLVAAEARAECAWVLWGQLNYWDTPTPAGPKQTGPWEVHQAFATRADCVAGMRRMAQSFAGTGTTVNEDVAGGSFGTVTITRDGGGRAFISGKCLPDTVDPRGPQGK